MKQRVYSHQLSIQHPEATLAFYQNSLNMSLLNKKESAKATHYFLGYQSGTSRSQEAQLELIDYKGKTRSPQSHPQAGYWKIAISVEDVDLARADLIKKGIEVGFAKQVPDVAYLCHLNGPEGYCIELIQHRFQQNHSPLPDNTHPWEHAHFSLITYRVKDPQASLTFYQESLGMRLLSRQIIKPFGFTLYFLGYSDEPLPVDDIDAIENREWLWQRPHTMIEFQHIWGTEQQDDFSYLTSPDTGFLGVVLHPANQANSAAVKDPDGYTLYR